MQPLFHLCISKGHFMLDLNPTLISIRVHTGHNNDIKSWYYNATLANVFENHWFQTECKETGKSRLLLLTLWFVFLSFPHQWVWQQSFIPLSHETRLIMRSRNLFLLLYFAWGCFGKLHSPQLWGKLPTRVERTWSSTTETTVHVEMRTAMMQL